MISQSTQISKGNSMDKEMNIFESAILLKMSPILLKWFTSYAPKYKESKKLNYIADKDGMFFFAKTDLIGFDKYLAMPWPSKNKDERPAVPAGIESEIKTESQFRCVICNHSSGQIAHIDPVHNSKNNHPHNLIFLCPNCHDLYDKKKTIKRKQIKNLKEEILQTKIVIWHSYTSLMDSVSSLIKEIKNVTTKEFENKKLQQGIIRELLEEIKNHVSNDFDTSPKDIKEQPKNEKYETYKKNIRKVLSKDIEVEESLIIERKNFITESGRSECPLCEGTGVHNEWECPVCRGTGSVDQAVLEDIDLKPFEQRECPLCEGSGIHNEWECHVCRGVGTVDQAALENIDLRPFEQEECPLCKGSGNHNEWECPVCRGVGTVDQAALDNIDLEPFEQEECPLCEGSGVHNERGCPICRGIGTVDQAALENIDLSDYE